MIIEIVNGLSALSQCGIFGKPVGSRTRGRHRKIVKQDLRRWIRLDFSVTEW